MSAVNWVFTLNFAGEVPVLSFDERVQYAVWQHERVNHDHIQGVIQLKKKAKMNTVKNIIGGNPHLEKMKGSIEEASAYAQKEESRVAGPWSYGELLKKGSHKRKIMELIKDPENELEEPQKYRRAMAWSAMDESRKLAEEEGFPYSLYSWQETVLGLLDEEPNDRTIIWVYGPNGNEGKSQFGKFLGLKKDYLYLPGGKTQDMTYMLMKNPKANVVMDIPRCNSEYLNYQFMELIKNRTIFSYKYEPVGCIINNKIHVIVLANVLPDYEKISQDRIKIIYC
ncbi:replication-associated protein [Faba bean necrotic yellows virus associated alphasatellite 2]|nr:replication-associated protein [Faba bean necrotic yellows virus associated alphasatellite 2]ATU31572.1 replication-associated protein [Faba bean necrotic yellows virus associated alphasatellite 2]